MSTLKKMYAAFCRFIYNERNITIILIILLCIALISVIFGRLDDQAAFKAGHGY